MLVKNPKALTFDTFEKLRDHKFPLGSMQAFIDWATVRPLTLSPAKQNPHGECFLVGEGIVNDAKGALKNFREFSCWASYNDNPSRPGTSLIIKCHWQVMEQVLKAIGGSYTVRRPPDPADTFPEHPAKDIGKDIGNLPFMQEAAPKASAQTA